MQIKPNPSRFDSLLNPKIFLYEADKVQIITRDLDSQYVYYRRHRKTAHEYMMARFILSLARASGRRVITNDPFQWDESSSLLDAVKYGITINRNSRNVTFIDMLPEYARYAVKNDLAIETGYAPSEIEVLFSSNEDYHLGALHAELAARMILVAAATYRRVQFEVERYEWDKIRMPHIRFALIPTLGPEFLIGDRKVRRTVNSDTIFVEFEGFAREPQIGLICEADPL